MPASSVILNLPTLSSLAHRVSGFQDLYNKYLWIPAFAGMTMIVSLFLFASSVSAQTSTPSASLPSSTNLVPSSVSPTSPLYTDLLVHNMFHTFSCLATGSSIIGQSCLTYQITKDAQGVIKSIPVLSQTNLSKGALGATVSMIDILYRNPPVRTADFLAVVGEDLGIKEAHAQVGGSGAQILNPIIKLWQVSRNLAYLLMILVFVIIGLMVMFRQRINPQTVVTAQAAIPGLVIGLILITFSFFLAGLLTDMAFIGTNVVGYYFSAASGGTVKTNFVQELATSPTGEPEKAHNVLTIAGRFLGEVKQGEITRAVEIVFNSMDPEAQKWVRVFAGIVGFQLGASIISGVTNQIGQLLDPILGIFGAATFAALPVQVAGWVVYFIALAVLIYNMIRLLLRLVNNFLSIIFLTISAPFHFLAASLPGRQEIATAWIFNMLCNVLAFPAVAAVFYFVAFITNFGGAPFNVISSTGITGTVTFPLFGGLDLFFIRIILAFAAILAAPAIPDIVCRTIGRVGVAGQLIGQEMGAQIGEGRNYYGIAVGGFQSDIGSVGRAGGGFIPGRELVYIPGRGYVEVSQPSAFARGWARLRGRPIPPPKLTGPEHHEFK